MENIGKKEGKGLPMTVWHACLLPLPCLAWPGLGSAVMEIQLICEETRRKYYTQCDQDVLPPLVYS